MCLAHNEQLVDNNLNLGVSCVQFVEACHTLDYVRAVRTRRAWDRVRGEFVLIPVQNSPDTDLSCSECRYFDKKSARCNGVGSRYYGRRIPSGSFVPRDTECEVRLPPELSSFVEIAR